MKQKNKGANQFDIFFRIRIFDKEEHFIGKGRVELLERIKESGSISKAAAEMKMSYRQAWQMVADMNKISDEPLVEKSLGGKGGGGTIVTARGEKVIAVFREVENEFEKFASEMSKKVNF